MKNQITNYMAYDFSYVASSTAAQGITCFMEPECFLLPGWHWDSNLNKSNPNAMTHHFSKHHINIITSHVPSYLSGSIF